MITLRENQEEPIKKAVAFFCRKEAKPSLIVLPTAWGKSILTAFVAKRCKEKILILQPSKELLEQNYRKYVDLCGDTAKAAIYSASFNSREIADVTYATIGSIKSLGAQFKAAGFKKMLIDEAHLYPREADSMLGTFLQESGITHVLGITATPVKLQQNYDKGGKAYSKLVMLTSRSKKGNFFREVLHVGQVQEMVQLGYWSRIRYRYKDFDGAELEFNSSRSEYTAESAHRAFYANGGVDAVLAAIEAHPERRHVLAFAPSVEDAMALATRCPDSAAIYGDMDKRERADVIARFRSGALRVVFNVRVLSTGFDYTGIDCIVLGMSTASIALYYQIIGRGTRIEPGKADCLVLDLGGNVARFGRIEDITFEKGRQWRMFGTGGRLLSGIPVHEIGRYTKEDTDKVDAKLDVPLLVMPFGKYKGSKFSDIPSGYRKWMLKNIDWNETNERLRRTVAATLQR